jgi:hypothetical protein
MRAWPALLLALAALPAAAQPAGEETEFLVSTRAGYGVPFGEVARDGEAVDEIVPDKFPLGLELGYRLTPRVHGDIYVELAPARVADAACGAGGSCRAYDLRFGLLFLLRLAPGRQLDPWIGIGVGVEVLQAEVQGADPAAPPGGSERRWTGIEVPLEAGVDVRISRRLALGPYVSASLAQFTSKEERPVGGTGATGPVDHRQLHGWLQAGLKATFQL